MTIYENWTYPRSIALVVFLGLSSAVFSYAQSPPVDDPRSGPPAINEGGAVLATLAPAVTTVSPSSIMTVFGTKLTTNTAMNPFLDEEGKIRTNLVETCFEIGGERVPIFAVTPTQYNVQVPVDAPLGPISLVAVRDCGEWFEERSEAASVTVESETPGFFLDPRATEYQLIAARFNSSPIAVAPPFLIGDPYGLSRPSKPGDVIDLYGTGWGKTTADLKTGELATSAAELLPEANPSVSFGGIMMDPEDIIYVGVAPGAAGLMQMVMRVPESAQPGNNEVVLTVYGKSTPTGPVIPVAAP